MIGSLRQLALLFFCALGSYVLAQLCCSPLLLWLTKQHFGPILASLGASLIIDGGKIPFWLGGAWFAGPRLMLSPIGATIWLLALTYGIELAIVAVIGELSGFLRPHVLVSRLPLPVIGAWLTWRVFARRRSSVEQLPAKRAEQESKGSAP
ncbi:MAG: hypothetical protein H6707_05355 [Deltaproteobacteria bacterium]|nr:hypothetical protein [Deltaproteobacteria bacterium]